MSDAALARRMGMAQSSISRRLIGDMALTLEDVSKIAAILGVREEELLTGERQSPRPGIPDGGPEDECAVRELNPQPADIDDELAPRRRARDLRHVLPETLPKVS
jgi:transcriptional regulator with XRE-family HTH domain